MCETETSNMIKVAIKPKTRTEKTKVSPLCELLEIKSRKMKNSFGQQNVNIYVSIILILMITNKIKND